MSYHTKRDTDRLKNSLLRLSLHGNPAFALSISDHSMSHNLSSLWYLGMTGDGSDNDPIVVDGDGMDNDPIVLDSAGRVPGGEIWLLMGSNYKFVLKTSTGTTIATFDNIYGSGSRVAYLDNFTGNASTVNFTLTAAPSDENNSQVYINGVYQQKNTYSLTGAGNILTFSQAPPLTSTIEVTYY